MSYDGVHIYELVEKAAQAVTDESGNFTNADHRAEIVRLLEDEANPAVETRAREEYAASLERSFIRARNPRKKKSGTLFDDYAILPLGHGQRVWMKDATQTDLLSWAALSTQNLARVAQREAERQQYVAERVVAMRDHPGKPLGVLERDVFGYEQDVEDPPYRDEEGDAW